MKKVLITGYMRSGTTFTANFLNSQSSVLVNRDFLHSIFREADALGIRDINQNIIVERKRNVLLASLKAEAWNIGGNIFDDIDSSGFGSIKELYEIALERLGKNFEGSMVGSKITMLGHWMAQIAANVDIYIVYLYRDPRDVMLSMYNRHSSFSLVKNVGDYSRDLEYASAVKNSNFRMIRFEDLILDKTNSVDGLSQFLGVPLSTSITSVKDRKTEWRDNSAFHDVKELFDSRSCYRWQRVATTSEKKFVYRVEIAMRNSIKRFGYASSVKSFSFEVFRIMIGVYFSRLKFTLLDFLKKQLRK